MKPILCATDLEATSDAAVREAHDRAAASGAPLVVLHVVDTPHPSAPIMAPALGSTPAELRAIYATTEARVIAQVNRVTGRRSSQYIVAIREGDAAVEIPRFAAEIGAEAVIVGAGHGASRQHPAPTGPVARAVVGKTPHAVVVAPRVAPHR
jgi:nucleotide-binding universal stress UspA family protein